MGSHLAFGKSFASNHKNVGSEFVDIYFGIELKAKALIICAKTRNFSIAIRINCWHNRYTDKDGRIQFHIATHESPLPKTHPPMLLRTVVVSQNSFGKQKIYILHSHVN